MINVGVIQGRLTADPELRASSGGVKVTSFTVAVDRGPGKDGERQADFIDVVAWRGTAELICNYFRKGSLILIKGRYQTRIYEDCGRKKQKKTELYADEIGFCGGQGRSMPENNNTEESSEYREIPEDDLPF